MLAKRVLKKFELPEEQRTNRWVNDDIAPVGPERQTWSRPQDSKVFKMNVTNVDD
jgi:hypothetical protein